MNHPKCDYWDIDKRVCMQGAICPIKDILLCCLQCDDLTCEDKCKDIPNTKPHKPSFEELKEAAQPLVDILYEYYDPHTAILVEMDHVEILCGDMVVPIEVRD